MAEEQGLSAANLALMQSVGLVLYSLGASDISVFHDIRGLDSRALNTLLDAARSEGPLPVGGEVREDLGSVGSGLTPLVPSRVSDAGSATPSGRWQEIASAPKDGTPIRIQTYEVFRWLAYKPDGARQMKRAGRWQKHDGFGFTNCPDPHGVWQPADAAPPTDCQTSGGAK